MSYRYQLSYLTVSRIIEPIEVGKIVVAKEQDEEFFREKMSGDLKLVGRDYEFLRNADTFNVNCCQEITLSISTACDGSNQLRWVGYFNLLDIDWNHDNKEASVSKINVKDEYDVVFRNWHAEINWLEFNELSPFQYQGTPFINLSYPEYNPTNSKTYLGRDFINMLRYLISQTFYKTESTQLTGATRQSLSRFLGDAINPVTGKENTFPYVVLSHASDAKRPGATNPAIKAMVSLKQVLDELKKLLNLYWFIDPLNGHFRLEHKAFFRGLPENLTGVGYVDLATTLDLTTVEHTDNVSGKNQVKTNTSALKGIEGLVINMNRSVYDDREAVNNYYQPGEEISSSYMSYSSQCVPLDDKGQKTEEVRNVSLFMTDFLSCLYYPQVVSEEGFVMVHTKWINGISDVVSSPTGIEKKNIRNGALSASRLCRDFLLFESSFSYGILAPVKEGSFGAENNTPHIVKKTNSTRTVRQYTTIQLSNCCGTSYDFSGYIKHPLFDKCLVDKIEIDTQNQISEISLVSISPCSDISIPDDEDGSSENPDCPAYGTFSRKEVRTYNMEAFGQVIAKVAMFMYYNDGKCGEYELGPYDI